MDEDKKADEASAQQQQNNDESKAEEEPMLAEENKQNEPEQTKIANDVEEVKVEDKKEKQQEQKLLVVDPKNAKPGVQIEEREDVEETNQSWSEYRVTGNAPPRRGYGSSFIHDNYIYVHGGHDIREGTIGAMYKVNLDPKGNENEWELIVQRGVEKPGNIAYHTLVGHENKAYLFGGSNLGKDNEKLFEFDIGSCEWKVIKPVSTENPLPRDEHCAVLWNDIMVVFGGNVRGFKSNDVWFYHIKENKWEEVKITDCPPERSNHAYAILDDTLYIFGGKCVDNNKLKDIWALDLNSKKWKKCDSNGDSPIERSGASLVGYQGFLVLFGGIFELTKELGD
jgi:hypothetical protein